MTFDNFVSFIKTLLSQEKPRSGNSVFLLEMKTGKELGPFPSVSYVSKNILKGANRHALAIASKQRKPFRGYIVKVTTK